MTVVRKGDKTLLFTDTAGPPGFMDIEKRRCFAGGATGKVGGHGLFFVYFTFQSILRRENVK